MQWKVRGIRGATTATENTKDAIAAAVTELMDQIEDCNDLDPEEIISITFTTTTDLDAIFPAAIARRRPGWNDIPLLDVQQMKVKGSLEKCIRVLIYFNTLKKQKEVHHVYLRGAQNLRRDWNLAQMAMSL
ncbi:MAG: chorismate mutase [Synechococcaceae cyanobacterium RL_1_2]|nr:chorismate mutase [Synechococcaceae cyanobacterium RL_1_2]